MRSDRCEDGTKLRDPGINVRGRRRYPELVRRSAVLVMVVTVAIGVLAMHLPGHGAVHSVDALTTVTQAAGLGVEPSTSPESSDDGGLVAAMCVAALMAVLGLGVRRVFTKPPERAFPMLRPPEARHRLAVPVHVPPPRLVSTVILR